MRKSSQILFVALLVLALTLSHPTTSFAKQEPPNTAISVTVSNLGCSTPAGTNAFAATAFSFGATQTGTTTSGGGGGAGKANVSDLHVSKAFNECSPALFGAVVTGKHFPAVKLVHADANGNPVLTVELQDVLVSSYQIGGSAGPDVPIENIDFAFAKICITENGSNVKLCWDAAAGKTF